MFRFLIILLNNLYEIRSNLFEGYCDLCSVYILKKNIFDIKDESFSTRKKLKIYIIIVIKKSKKTCKFLIKTA